LLRKHYHQLPENLVAMICWAEFFLIFVLVSKNSDVYYGRRDIVINKRAHVYPERPAVGNIRMSLVI